MSTATATMPGVILPGNSTVEFKEYPIPEPGHPCARTRTNVIAPLARPKADRSPDLSCGRVPTRRPPRMHSVAIWLHPRFAPGLVPLCPHLQPTVLRRVHFGEVPLLCLVWVDGERVHRGGDLDAQRLLLLQCQG